MIVPPKRWLVPLLLSGGLFEARVWGQQAKKLAATGVSTPGIQQPIGSIKPSAFFKVSGAPDWMAVTKDAVWVASSPKNEVVRLDAKTNKTSFVVSVKKPCSGLAYGFGSVWSPSCGERMIVRFNAGTGAMEAKIPVGPADSEGGISVGDGSVWMVIDKAGILARIDPKTNTVSKKIAVPPGSVSCAFGDGAVWVTSPEQSVVARVDTSTNLVTNRISVGKNPRFITFGSGSAWSLNQGDGTISRIDARTRKAVTIDPGLTGDGGEIAFGEGAIWATLFGFPITKIDVKTNKVVKQWTGPGGDSIRAGLGSVWLTDLKGQQVMRIDVGGL